MNSIEVQSIRSKLWSNGYRPIAVYSHDATIWTGQPIANRGKAPKGNKWQERARQNPPEAAIASPSDDAQNTGILCDGLAGVDIDADNPAIVSQIKSLAAQYLGNAPSRTRADSPRCLYLYRAAEGEPSKRSVNGKHGKVEVLGRGNQFVAYGVHPDGVAYEWPDGAPDGFHRDVLTPVTQEAIHAFLCAVAPLIEAEMPQSPSATAGGPVLPIVAGARPAATEREKSNALGGLNKECQKFQAVAKGHRNEALNNAAVSIATMVASGRIEAKLAWDTLWEAASLYRAEDGDEAAYKTMLSGWNYGIVRPRDRLPVVKAQECFETKRSGTTSVKRPVTLLSFSQIPLKRVEWLWRGYLPKGNLTLLAAIGGVGKSTITLNWASIISTSGQWPDGSQCDTPGNVLIWSSEDDPSTIIGPRLVAAGADLTRCQFIQGPKDEDGNARSFDPATDMEELNRAVSQLGQVSLLIVDPIMNAVTGDVFKPNIVRRSLQPIVDFASRMNCAVVGISHFGKNTQGKQSAERILGSAAFKDFARTALVAVQDEDTGDCAMARAKSNLAANTGGFAYRIEVGTIPGGFETTRIVWGEELKGSARSILGRFEGEHKEDGEKLSEAKQFLIEMLSNGPVQGKEVIRYAREGYDISEDTLRTAYKQIGAKFVRAGYAGPSMWSLKSANQQQ